MPPAVSVIVTTYNRSSLLLETIDSVFTQSMTDYELIVVNDGSTDDTAAVLEPLVADGRIRYTQQPNQGISAARNAGFSQARGKYIAYLDDDDLFVPQKLEWQVQFLEGNPEFECVAGARELFGRENVVFVPPSDRVRFKDLFAGCHIGTPGQALMRKKALDEIVAADRSFRGLVRSRAWRGRGSGSLVPALCTPRHLLRRSGCPEVSHARFTHLLRPAHGVSRNARCPSPPTPGCRRDRQNGVPEGQRSLSLFWLCASAPFELSTKPEFLGVRSRGGRPAIPSGIRILCRPRSCPGTRRVPVRSRMEPPPGLARRARPEAPPGVASWRKAMDISVVICTRNRAEDLRATLKSLAAARVPEGRACELIVVDNGSTDHTKSVVEEYSVEQMPVRYVYDDRIGKSNAYNTALSLMEGDIFLGTDDDVRVPPNWIEAMTRPIFDDEADMVAGLSVVPDGYIPEEFRREGYELAIPGGTDYIDRNSPGCATGVNMAFHKRVTADVEGFDLVLGSGTPLGFAEDTLFTSLVHNAGYRLMCVTDAPVEHRFDLSRLARESVCRTAVRAGSSWAYVDYHARLVPQRLSLLRFLTTSGKLAALRLIRRRETRFGYGMPSWEWQLLKKNTTTWPTPCSSADREDISDDEQYQSDRQRPLGGQSHSALDAGDPLNIAIVIPGRWNSDAYTIDFRLVAEGLAFLGHHVRFVCLKGSKHDTRFAVETVDYAQLADPGYWRTMGLDLALVQTWCVHGNVVRAIKQAGIDVIAKGDSDGILSIRSHPGLTFHKMVRLLTTPSGKARAAWHWTKRYFVLYREEYRELLDLLETCDAFIFETVAARTEHRRFLEQVGRLDLERKIHVVPNAVSGEFLTADVPELKDDVVLAVGQWDSLQKDAPLLVKVIRKHLAPPEHAIQADRERWRRSVCRTCAHVPDRHVPRDGSACRNVGLHSRGPNRLITSLFESFHIAAHEALASGASVVGPRAVIPVVDICNKGPFGSVAEDRTCNSIARALHAEEQAWSGGERSPGAIAEFSRPWLDQNRIAGTYLSIARELVT